MIYNKVLVTAVSTHGEQLVRVWRIIVDHHWAASLSGRRSLGPHIEIDCAALKRRAGQAQRTQLLLASEGARGRPSFDKCRQEMSAGATGSLLWRGNGWFKMPLLLWGCNLDRKHLILPNSCDMSIICLRTCTNNTNVLFLHLLHSYCLLPKLRALFLR